MNKVFEIVTDKIIAQLETGVIPWSKSWVNRPPVNITGRLYGGINLFTLYAEGFSSNIWLSYKQAMACGGNVKKGVKGSMAIFWKILNVHKDDEVKHIPFLRYHTVFNLEQCDNVKVPDRIQAMSNNLHTWDPLQQAETVVSGMPSRPDIRHQEQRAYYHPKDDYVNMPIRESFAEASGYYATLFHELAHSTGHATRLDRGTLSTVFSSDDYAKEELVAELGAAFLCAHAGIENKIDNSAAYIQSWIKALQNAKSMSVYAAARAQNAAAFILNEIPNQIRQSEAA
ncbi:MAG: zincin-like metallopeptidase domain-containing protein [Fibrobacterota bacterium]